MRIINLIKYCLYVSFFSFNRFMQHLAYSNFIKGILFDVDMFVSKVETEKHKLIHDRCYIVWCILNVCLLVLCTRALKHFSSAFFSISPFTALDDGKRKKMQITMFFFGLIPKHSWYAYVCRFKWEWKESGQILIQ